MQVFYIRDISGKLCSLDENESRHCIKVLRLKKGDEVSMIDGKGNLFSGRIADANPKKCTIEVTDIKNDFEKIASGIPFHICYHIEHNYWQGKTSLQLCIKDIKFDLP